MTSPPADDRWTANRRYITVQRGYLRNPLPKVSMNMPDVT
jgi:hypothetical protein